MNAPSVIWARHGEVFVGGEVTGRFDPGTGPQRYRRALDWLRSTDASRAWASFTFDPEEPGSVVLTVAVGPTRSLPLRTPPGGRVIDDGIEVWRQGFRRAQELLATHDLEKVVLARRMELELDQHVDPWSLVAHLSKIDPTAYVFAVDGLVGATPELLVEVVGENVRSQTLAGTATVPEGLETDVIEAEHRIAVVSTRNALVPHLEFISESRETVQAGPMLHAATSLSGPIKRGSSLTDLLSSLHPTAAVGGWPPLEALATIRVIEPRSRGRYAGPVGWIDRDGGGLFALALRCASISGLRATLYAGGGLVFGAVAEDELKETDLKLMPMLSALGSK